MTAVLKISSPVGRLLPRLMASALLAALCAVSVAQTSRPGNTAPQPAKSPSAPFTDLSGRAMAALDADHLDQAIPLFRKALRLNPKWTEGWWSLGTALYDQDRYADAAAAFQKVIAVQPKHGTAHAMLGLCQFQLGDDQAALGNIEAAKNLGTGLDPQLRDVIFYHEGILLQRDGRFVAAQAAFSSLCRGGIRSDDVLRGFGLAALRMRDRSMPANSHAAAIVSSIGNAECLASQKDFDAAKDEFARALAVDPRFPWAHFALGRLLIDAQDIPAAVAEFKTELEHNPDRVPVLLQIAAAEYKVDSAAGLPFAREAVKESPQVSFAHFLLGLLLMNTGAPDQAVPELEIAGRGMPHDAKVFWALSSAYQQAGRPQDAARARAEFARLKRQDEARVNALAAESPEVVVNTGEVPAASSPR
jgi:tetratricopeptide (TPR) repeat protein